MLPRYEGVYKAKQIIIDFEPARENLMKEDYKKVVKRRFKKLNIMMGCKSYIENEDLPENKEIFVYGFKHVKTDKIDNYILTGCESEKLDENKKLFKFWSNKIINDINEEIEKRDFKIRGWSFLTLVTRNNFFKKITGYVCN